MLPKIYSLWIFLQIIGVKLLALLQMLKMRLLKVLVISLILTLGYFAFLSYPYFFSKINRFDSLGFLSLVEERSVNIQRTFSTERKTDEFDIHLLKGEKAQAKLRANGNNLGVVLVRFAKLSARVSDTVVFRIKREGEGKWYYENKYKANQFQPNEYFTFGFPPIAQSKNNTYVFEVESLAGTYRNGIGISADKPQTAFVYKYSREELKNYKTFLPFVFKKLIYAARNVNYWQIASTFALSLLLIISMERMRSKALSILSLLVLFMRRKKEIAALDIAKILSVLKKEHRRILGITVNEIKSDYLFLEKKIVNFSKKATRSFTSIKFYSLLLNTDRKKRLIIGLLIFLLALIYRFSSTLVNQHLFFYAGLGGRGDYDQFIRAATCAVKTFCPAILGQNFLIESSILGVFYEIFGFTGGLRVYLYLMIILSSIVAALPYLILSRKNFLTIGGIIGSLFLATSDYLTNMALALPPDNGSLFLFSMFFIVYFFTLQFGTIRWLLFFGLMGTIDGLNKLMLLINDLAALILFVPVFFYEKARKINKFPFIKLNPKLVFYSILPLSIFLMIYSAWEYIVQIKFSTPYFLRKLVETGGGGSYYISTTSFNESLARGNILQIVYYYAGSTIVMLKRLIENAGLNDLLLTPILLGLLFATFRKRKFIIINLISVIIFLAISFTVFVLFINNYLHIQDIGQYVYAWTMDMYINAFLFAAIFFLFILNFKYKAFKLSLPIIPYVIMLDILTKNAPWARLLAHVIVWSIILFSFLIDWILSNTKENYALKRLFLGPIILALFILFYVVPKTSIMTGKIISGINTYNNEIKYLKWANSELPKETIILAGGKSDLVSLAENIKRPIIYNSLWTGAVLIKPKEIPGVKPTDFAILSQLKISQAPTSDFSIVTELKNKDNFEKNKYFILEDDITLWRGRMEGIVDNLFSSSSATLLHGDDYTVTLYKFNSTLRKGIYELNIKETENL